jgi:hypothetical protein
MTGIITDPRYNNTFRYVIMCKTGVEENTNVNFININVKLNVNVTTRN